VLFKKLIRNWNRSKLQASIERYRSAPTQADGLAAARRLIRMGRLDEALSWLRSVRQDLPSSRPVRRFYDKVRKKKALSALSRARREARESPSAANLVQVCEYLRIGGRARQAFRQAAKANRLFPENWQVKLALGRLHFDRFSLTRDERDGWPAVDHFEQSRALNPKDYTTLLLLAITLTRLGAHEDALEVTEEILASRPADPRALGLKDYASNCLTEQLAASLESSGGEPDHEAPAPGESHLERVMALPHAAGAFLFDEQAQVADTLVRENGSFDFSVPLEVLESIAATCRLEAERIGLGALQWCSLQGEGWTAGYRILARTAVLAFLESEICEEELKGAFDAALQGQAAGELEEGAVEGSMQCATS
jgi:tetratricopeptide (TPR) repeat protein